MEFGRRMAVERELEKSDSLKYVNPGVVIHLSITIYIAMKSTVTLQSRC